MKRLIMLIWMSVYLQHSD